MDIYAFIGRSGTGKSYKAQYVAGCYDIEYIIDDGLLIKGNKVIAGVSAKKESTRIAAVKRAVFKDAEHREKIKEAIREHAIDKLLIIGTSEHMIKSIIDALELDRDYKIIRIEDVSEPEEIEEATKSRRVKGKHVIPVPTFEIKKDFSGYFLDSIKMLTNKSNKEHDLEKTVVRPTFSYLGKYNITNGALKTIIFESAKENDRVARVLFIDIENKPNGIIINLSLSLYLKEPLNITAKNIMERVKDNVEYMTGINIISVNILIKSIKIDQE
ncbi:Asp23/Gls24 family envelope stress response protein [Caloramator sp. E03]|uniref:Asp23/Gls24 family envelope stress response protein n=1 Tax=Caloramator sp. E03 TaxID=2576307 RepID=UPI001110324B|nr:Asp23/Gls24 family envelope stress response protein [Caloramator sp. E03]QCX34036.1 Asp23/Gls24 family envelope stress response protein [Caloramator sp. E03]